MRYLVYSFDYKPDNVISYAIDLMCMHASKLWNVANYERNEYAKLSFANEPDWFDQKKRLKENDHYKMLLAQSSQDLLKDLDLAWKSYHALKARGYQANAPKYKKHGQHSLIKYAHHSFSLISEKIIRFSLPKNVKRILFERYGKSINFFYIKLKQKIINPKSVSFKHIKAGLFRVSIAYEKNEPFYKEDNGRHIGIDLGVANLFAIYDNNGSSFIINGSSLKNTIYYFSKKIAYYQRILKASNSDRHSSQAYTSKRINRLYQIKMGRINYLLHASTKKIADYCKDNDITVVVIGDMHGIKNKCSFGHVSKQQFYSVAFAKIVNLLQYKLDNIGVKLVKVDEAYSSQCPPYSDNVSKSSRLKNRRKKRGLYKSNQKIYNSDCLGAYNILRIHYQNTKESQRLMDYKSISNPKNICIPVTLNFNDFYPCLDIEKKVGVAGRNYPNGAQIMGQIHLFTKCSVEA